MFCESSENQFGQPKKKVRIFDFFLKVHPPPPPRENPRSVLGILWLKINHSFDLPSGPAMLALISEQFRLLNLCRVCPKPTYDFTIIKIAISISTNCQATRSFPSLAIQPRHSLTKWLEENETKVATQKTSIKSFR